MATERQKVGERGEKLVAEKLGCPRCKRPRTLSRLVRNFKCADIICDFCGYLAQVKSITRAKHDQLPDTLSGAAWQPVKDRMDAGIYFPLFVVVFQKGNPKLASVWYLAPDLQLEEMFVQRNPSQPRTRSAPWQGVKYDLKPVKDRFVRLM